MRDPTTLATPSSGKTGGNVVVPLSRLQRAVKNCAWCFVIKIHTFCWKHRYDKFELEGLKGVGNHFREVNMTGRKSCVLLVLVIYS